ncbi:hypothetical protein CLNEO_07480 [Anaerotignum neopropionicum]|uniref:Uncharacterized protein n=1 Tax=Anaerotignum neopropionicum TaxID=36847 RepID=A0A136WG85_9FIRM|nr:DUF6762 family protein [Anaerotignum neopropionicum]KXL53522.1 hypothetical protein CLNEO_07480 [Anaerotignum neopropionicum]
MEDTVIVVMLKDRETGFLEKELGSYSFSEDVGMVYNIYAVESEEGKKVVLRLSCDKEIEDWEYDAIFDYYDMEPLAAQVESVEEEEGHYNPVWVIQFTFSDTHEEMEKKISHIVNTHKKELLSVYDAIADKKDDYIEE